MKMKKLIKEMSLTNLGYIRAQGITKSSDLRKLKGSIVSIIKDMEDDGFEDDEIAEFIKMYITRNVNLKII